MINLKLSGQVASCLNIGKSNGKIPELLVSLFLLALMFSACKKSENATEADNEQRPNIILIISDDQGWTDYSFMGHPVIETPRIDKLAEESLTFTYGYTTAPLCRPALASIATGLYPHQHRVLGNDPVFMTEGVKNYSEEWMIVRAQHNEPFVAGLENMQTIAHRLGEIGYQSLQTGKWWEGNYAQGGFDQGMTHGDPARGGRHGDEGLVIGREGLQNIYDFIDENHSNDNPFFVWYAPFLPHFPHTPPDSLLQKYSPKAPTEAVAKYWAMCEWFDITCGQLIDYVEKKGIRENTIFVYVTDNGWIQDAERTNKYAPRSKRAPYEMGIRTPIMFNWKGEISPKMVEDQEVSSIDIATTILAICDLIPSASLQGVNLLDQEQLEQRGAIFAENYAHDFSTVDSSLYHRIVIDLPYKLIVPDPNNQSENIPELYHLVTDPHETNDLSATHPEKVVELTGKIEDWWQEP